MNGDVFYYLGEITITLILLLLYDYSYGTQVLDCSPPVGFRIRGVFIGKR